MARRKEKNRESTMGYLEENPEEASIQTFKSSFTRLMMGLAELSEEESEVFKDGKTDKKAFNRLPMNWQRCWERPTLKRWIWF